MISTTQAGSQRICLSRRLLGALALCCALASCQAADQMEGMSAPTDSLTLLAGEPLRPAVDFINSIGVVTKLTYGDTPYYTRFATVIRPLLVELGVRHLRDELSMNQASVVANMRSLVNAGLDFSMVCDQERTTPEGALATAKQIGGGLAFIEGPNEFDNNRTDQSWVPVVRAYAQRLYSVMRADPLTQSVPILSPSFFKQTTPALVGDMSHYIDYANIHVYEYPNPPTRTHRLAVMMARFSAMYGAKPFIITETGYNTGGPNADRRVSETVQSKYLPRQFLEYYNAGIARTYSYEFLDEGTDPNLREQHFGLLRYDGSRKPAFNALRNLIAVLQDTRRPATLKSVKYTFTSTTDSIHRTLLQKSDGTIFMIFWQEVLSSDAAKQGAATLTLASPFGTIRVYRPDQSATAIASYTNTSSVTFMVPDSPVIVALTL